ncbi:MAG: integration host factor subunit alpha [Holosporales bacterium]
MSQRTLTRQELTDVLAVRVGLPRQKAGELLEAALDQMVDSLVKDGELKLSSFGSFAVRSKRARVGRNPKTGTEVTITPRRTISFRASHILKDRVERRKGR